VRLVIRGANWPEQFLRQGTGTMQHSVDLVPLVGGSLNLTAAIVNTCHQTPAMWA
jgi:hypothetical protein